MYKRLAAVLLLLGTTLGAQDFRLGSKISDFGVDDISGKPVRFAALRGAVTVVAFFSTKCPISAAFNERMNTLYKDYSAKGVKFIFVDANANEPVSEIVEYAHSAGFTFPVYKDTGNRVADQFGAMATPETYVIDPGGILRYHGYIDDSTNPARVRNHGLKSALDAVLHGEPVAVPETKAFGCTIKRNRRTT